MTPESPYHQQQEVSAYSVVYRFITPNITIPHPFLPLTSSLCSSNIGLVARIAEAVNQVLGGAVEMSRP